MNEEKVKRLADSLQEFKKRIPILAQDNKITAQMLDRLLRPFLIALIENNQRFSGSSLSIGEIIQRTLEIFSQKNDFPVQVAESIKERYAIAATQAIDWVQEVTFTSVGYNHPVSKLRNFVFAHLSPEGQTVSAMQSMKAVL